MNITKILEDLNAKAIKLQADIAGATYKTGAVVDQTVVAAEVATQVANITLPTVDPAAINSAVSSQLANSTEISGLKSTIDTQTKIIADLKLDNGYLFGNLTLVKGTATDTKDELDDHIETYANTRAADILEIKNNFNGTLGQIQGNLNSINAINAKLSGDNPTETTTDEG